MRGLLRRAAARRPAELRADTEREWLAELAALEAEPGTRVERLRFVLSLFLSRPERGWGESFAPLTPAFALLVAGLTTLGVLQVTNLLVTLVLRLLGADYLFGWNWPRSAAGVALALIWCVAAGRWVARRWPMALPGRATAPLVLAVVPALTMISGDRVFLIGAALGVLAWAAAGAGLILLAARLGRPLRTVLLLAGAPLISTLAGVVSTVPLALTTRDGWRSSVTSLLMTGEPPAEFTEIIGLTSRSFSYMGPWVLVMLAFSTLAFCYAFAPLAPRPAKAAAPAEEPPAHGAPVIAIGVACTAAGVLAWAYTLAILTPGMGDVSASAPMPGGDGELYMWTSELRFTAILLAAFGVLIAAADRRTAVAGTIVTGAGLLIANGVLLRQGAHGAGGLRIALLLGAAVIVAGWAAAGRTRRGPVRRRITAGVVLAGAILPMVLMQGTPGVNHPFLPIGLKITTVGLAVAGLLLAVVPALSYSRHRVPIWAAVPLIALPVTVTLIGGAIPPALTEDDSGSAWLGLLLGLPVVVVCLALLRRHRHRGPGRTVALWTVLTVLALPATVAVAFIGMLGLTFVPETVFMLEGGGYSFDGLSFVPGTAVLMLPIAVLLAAGVDGRSTAAPAERAVWNPDLETA
ncbi:hypothetical protein ACIA8K_33590 [Catenuloplanes sp. NPDC051500]|uniref:hypothetical protein n=1 Tax=Catenuloplanes sp. NPDC051500 TaxID=3363959 RepID=UPI00379CDF8F